MDIPSKITNAIAEGEVTQLLNGNNPVTDDKVKIKPLKRTLRKQSD